MRRSPPGGRGRRRSPPATSPRRRPRPRPRPRPRLLTFPPIRRRRLPHLGGSPRRCSLRRPHSPLQWWARWQRARTQPRRSGDRCALGAAISPQRSPLRAALVVTILALALAQALATDPSPLQDFCIADNKSPLFINGLVCKDPMLAKTEDFFFSGLDKPTNTDNAMGFNVTLASAANLPGLNTLGISIGRLDFAPNGLNPPHTHPRATEVLTLMEGSLFVGFVTSNPAKLFAKTLKKGDVFVFPMGMIHFQQNVGREPAVALAGLSSQNPGVITIANAVFGSKPPIPEYVLQRAFQVDKKVIEELMAPFKKM